MSDELEKRTDKIADYLAKRQAVEVALYGNTMLELQAENTLMNELVKDLKKRVEELEGQVNRLSRALVFEGITEGRIRSLLDG